MSVVKSYSIFCDVSIEVGVGPRDEFGREDHCIGWVAQENSAAAAREVARNCGWRRRRPPENPSNPPRDECSRCSKLVDLSYEKPRCSCTWRADDPSCPIHATRR